MALKFQCKNCGEDIAVRFLKVGEAAECRNCGASNSVPESAESIDDEAAEHLIKAPVSESVEDISAEAISDEPAQSVPMAKALRRVGNRCRNYCGNSWGYKSDDSTSRTRSNYGSGS